MALFSVNPGVRVRIYRQGGPADLGPWCVVLYTYGRPFHHIARHTSRRSAMAHAKRLRAAIKLDGGGR